MDRKIMWRFLVADTNEQQYFRLRAEDLMGLIPLE
jgi:hypothetical protein